ncbi:hypothetical protein AC630_25305 [Bradyrhizobium sp. AS23.2]|nr:hypothetical protein AC630_25305 [Bradyrhizobium sp. AS23.2]
MGKFVAAVGTALSVIFGPQPGFPQGAPSSEAALKAEPAAAFAVHRWARSQDYGAPLQTKREHGSACLALAALLAVMTDEIHEMLGPMTRPG